MRTRTRVAGARSSIGLVDQQCLAGVLTRLAESGPQLLRLVSDDVDAYLGGMASLEPDKLSRPAAQAYWINLYNGGALRLAAQADEQGEESVFRIPGGFSAPFVRVGGEELSLDGIEFKWFGGGFSRPKSMPTWAPGSKRNIVKAIQSFLPTTSVGG